MSVTKLIAGKHSCVGHLSLGGEASENKARLEKPAMLVYCGQFDSMDGPVTITEEHINTLIKNHNEKLDRLTQANMTREQVERAMAPLQLDHSTSARDTIGRVAGRLFKGTYKGEDGMEVPSLHCEKVIVLGAENVAPVDDGRWANISIGADLEQCTLNELSITPFPAAPNAALLSRQRLMKEIKYNGAVITVNQDKDGQYEAWVQMEGLDSKPHFHFPTEDEVLAAAKKEVDDLKQNAKLSQGDQMEETKEQLKARHLQEKEALSSQHTEELKTHKLEEVKVKHEGQMKALQDKHAEELKKLGVVDSDGDHDGDKEAKEMSQRMAAAKPKLVTMAKNIKSGLSNSRLAARQQMITARVARLRASAKMTPAEQKKLDLVSLSKQSDGELDSFFKGYEIRENVIDTRFHGTIKALSLAKLENLTSDARRVRLTAETKKDLGQPLTAEEQKSLEAEVPVAPAAANEKNDHDEMMSHLSTILADHPSKDSVLAHVKKMMDCKQLAEMPAEQAEGAEKQMSALVNDVNKLQTEFQDFIALVGEAAGIQESELK